MKVILRNHAALSLQALRLRMMCQLAVAAFRIKARHGLRQLSRKLITTPAPHPITPAMVAWSLLWGSLLTAVALCGLGAAIALLLILGGFALWALANHPFIAAAFILLCLAVSGGLLLYHRRNGW